jgi:AraC-like DNA-binding protein
MFETNSEPLELALSDSSDGRHEWRKVNSDAAGMNFEFEGGCSVGTSAKFWALGTLDFIALRAVNLSLAPIPAALEDYMFVKLVKSGAMLVESKRGVKRFAAGSLLVTDPIARYKQRFDRRTELVALRFPRQLLVERGFRASLPDLCVPNMETPDARAIGDLLLAIASQNGTTSRALRERQGAHVLDLMGVVAGDPSTVSRAGRSDVTFSRAKSYIAQHLHDVDLDVKRIATALGVSNAHLHRAFNAADTSLMRHVWSCRLERAAELLARRYMATVTIREIAYRCGFQNAAHFSRAFKERFGISPREAASYGVPDTQCPIESGVKE